MDYIEIFKRHYEAQLTGRYITLEMIADLFQKPNRKGKTVIIGQSVNHNPLYAYRVGTGKIRILMWSQMHGNESTSTKALFDLFNFLDSDTEHSNAILGRFEFCFIPMLNPDGAVAYTRENANNVDLNRDFVNFTQPESTALQNIFEQFRPDYCYNLHDQRTIFGVGNTEKPATISFLSPSFDETLQINECRTKAIAVINNMNKVLQTVIPGQVGRFDDAFNQNCAGDHFQQLGVPTILIEAGHYQDDYERDRVRMYFFIALLSGLDALCENDVVNADISEYEAIPQNNASFYDIVYKNVKIIYDKNENITNFASQYKEELRDGAVHFTACVEKIDGLENYYGHLEYDAHGSEFNCNGNSFPILGQKADFNLGKDTKIVNGLIKM